MLRNIKYRCQSYYGASRIEWKQYGHWYYQTGEGTTGKHIPWKHILRSIQNRRRLNQVSYDILNAIKTKNEVATQPSNRWTHPRHTCHSSSTLPLLRTPPYHTPATHGRHLGTQHHIIQYIEPQMERAMHWTQKKDSLCGWGAVPMDMRTRRVLSN